MPKCPNPQCLRYVADGYSFCSACGADRRPAAIRRTVLGHVHHYNEALGTYYMWCGEPKKDAIGVHPRWQIPAAAALLAAGLLLAVLALGMFL